MEDNGHQASNDFLGRQDCSPHRAPITLTLRRYSLHYEFTTNDMSWKSQKCSWCSTAMATLNALLKQVFDATRLLASWIRSFKQCLFFREIIQADSMLPETFCWNACTRHSRHIYEDSLHFAFPIGPYVILKRRAWLQACFFNSPPYLYDTIRIRLLWRSSKIIALFQKRLPLWQLDLDFICKWCPHCASLYFRSGQHYSLYLPYRHNSANKVLFYAELW